MIVLLLQLLVHSEVLVVLLVVLSPASIFSLFYSLFLVKDKCPYVCHRGFLWINSGSIRVSSSLYMVPNLSLIPHIFWRYSLYSWNLSAFLRKSSLSICFGFSLIYNCWAFGPIYPSTSCFWSARILDARAKPRLMD